MRKGRKLTKNRLGLAHILKTNAINICDSRLGYLPRKLMKVNLVLTEVLVFQNNLLT